MYRAMRSAIHNNVRVDALSFGQNCTTMWYSVSLSLSLRQARCSKLCKNVSVSAHYTFCPFLSGELGNVNNACLGAYYWSSNIALKGKMPKRCMLQTSVHKIFNFPFAVSGEKWWPHPCRWWHSPWPSSWRSKDAQMPRSWGEEVSTDIEYVYLLYFCKFLHTTQSILRCTQWENTQALIKDCSFIMFCSRVKHIAPPKVLNDNGRRALESQLSSNG